LKNSDFVVLIVPSTPQTKNLIGKKQLDQMKKTATLINIGRGSVVDHTALIDALSNKTIRGVALDVTDPEPLARNSPLLKMNNVIISPHLGSQTLQTRKRMTEMTLENLFLGLEGKSVKLSS